MYRWSCSRESRWNTLCAVVNGSVGLLRSFPCRDSESLGIWEIDDSEGDSRKLGKCGRARYEKRVGKGSDKEKSGMKRAI